MSDPAFATNLLSIIDGVKSLLLQVEALDGWPFRLPKGNTFRVDMGKLMGRIRDSYTMAGLKDDLCLFPLLGVSHRYDSGYDITKNELRVDLEKTLHLLTERLKREDLQAFLTVATKEQISELLKAVRQRRGDSREQAAPKCGVSADSIKSWESATNHPAAENIPKLAEYLNPPDR